YEEISRKVGGKGASLWVMTQQLGLPVPPGFTISTNECRSFLEHGFRAELAASVEQALNRVGQQLGRRFGDAKRPLLVSVRSGAVVSMPGMMDTVLNVGLTQATTEELARLVGDRCFALNLYRRFLHMYASVVLHEDIAESVCDEHQEATLVSEIDSLRDLVAQKIGTQRLDDPWELLYSTIGAVFHSWNSPRAQVYREHEGIPNDLYTAVNVQAMVFGNFDDASGTGVVFTRNPSTGEAHPTGDFLFHAQGEDVVNGTHRTLPLSALEQKLPHVYRELCGAMEVLEGYYRDMCDIEFTVEQGRLWILQARVGKRSTAAAARIAVELAEDARFGLSRREAIARVPRERVADSSSISHSDRSLEPIVCGIGVSPGVATGHIVFDPDQAVVYATEGTDVILVRRETSPKDVHGMSVAKGILTTLGGLMSHAAVVARAWGIPAVCGAEGIVIGESSFSVEDTIYREGDVISIDGDSGEVFLGEVTTLPVQDVFLEKLRTWIQELE
ncbi:MAG: pyruvate, phosphate dikinase, partial [Chloroflexota bacterium]|nr:pyruvate, phosphate dikinase [Chloroflexota bacterium]